MNFSVCLIFGVVLTLINGVRSGWPSECKVHSNGRHVFKWTNKAPCRDWVALINSRMRYGITTVTCTDYLWGDAGDNGSVEFKNVSDCEQWLTAFSNLGNGVSAGQYQLYCQKEVVTSKFPLPGTLLYFSSAASCDAFTTDWVLWNAWIVTNAPTSSSPTKPPTSAPTSSSPTTPPTNAPTSSTPTKPPTNFPISSSPTRLPTIAPTSSTPTKPPTKAPTSSNPTLSPTKAPTSSNPTKPPTTHLIILSTTTAPATTVSDLNAEVDSSISSSLGIPIWIFVTVIVSILAIVIVVVVCVVKHRRTPQQPQTQSIGFTADGAPSSQGFYLNPQYQKRPQMGTSNQGNNGTHDGTYSGLECQYNTVQVTSNITQQKPTLTGDNDNVYMEPTLTGDNDNMYELVNSKARDAAMYDNAKSELPTTQTYSLAKQERDRHTYDFAAHDIEI